MEHLHNFMRWLILIFAVITLAKSFKGMSGTKSFTPADKKMPLFLMICCDIQLLLGLSLYFMKGWFSTLSSGGAFASKASRFFTVEHSVGMIVALILVHISYSAAKKAGDDKAKFKKVFWFTLVALVLIIATIPWPFRAEIGRPLFPGMN
jgi:hypothetical protein